MNRIRFLRQKSGMKQEELAEKIMVSQSSLSGYENGKFEPDSKTLLKIAATFHVSVDYLLGGPDRFPGDRLPARIPIYGSAPDDLPEQGSALFDCRAANQRGTGNGTYFGLYLDTDYMEPRICAGDLVIARRQAEVPNGSAAVMRVGKRKAFVKNFWRLNDGEVMLLSLNAKYGPEIYTAEQVLALPVRVLGLAVELRGKIAPR